MNCHMHQGNLFVNPYLGYTWWDQETDGEFMYPKTQHNPTDAELVHRRCATIPKPPPRADLWDNLDFLEKVAELNPQLNHTQFADYHGHGWVFRAVFKNDRKGNLLDSDDKLIRPEDPHKFAKAVHLKDVHLAARHAVRAIAISRSTFTATACSTAKPRTATTIKCIDCHGTIEKRPTLVTTGNGGQIDLNQSTTPWGPRFVWEGNKLFQYSSMRPDVRWEIPQTIDTIDPASPHYNPKSAYAKTLRRDGRTWGDVPPHAECPARQARARQFRRSPARFAIPRGPRVVSAAICR